MIFRPIRWMSIRRNEVSDKASTNSAIYIEDQRQQRTSLLLRDVRYGIVAHFNVLPSHKPGRDERENAPEKHLAMFTRRAAKGQHFHQPYLGCREFAASYRLATEGFSPCRLPVSQCNRDLGWVLYDLAWPEARAMVFKAQMINGVVAIPQLREVAR